MSDAHLFEGYGPLSGFDEMISHDGDDTRSALVRENYAQVHASFVDMGDDEVRQRADALASSYLDQGITFGVEGEERPFPLDIVPRRLRAVRRRRDHPSALTKSPQFVTSRASRGA